MNFEPVLMENSLTELMLLKKNLKFLVQFRQAETSYLRV